MREDSNEPPVERKRWENISNGVANEANEQLSSFNEIWIGLKKSAQLWIAFHNMLERQLSWLPWALGINLCFFHFIFSLSFSFQVSFSFFIFIFVLVFSCFASLFFNWNYTLKHFVLCLVLSVCFVVLYKLLIEQINRFSIFLHSFVRFPRLFSICFLWFDKTAIIRTVK